ncbi:MAG: RsmB/NOP family class I SAM-dependent RNA methyltransferase [Pseudomonadota bacterium]
MTPGAQVAAAIDVLDQIAAGTAAEKALIAWARKSRFAGSKDREAVRDHVFDVLRCRRLAAHYGQGDTGRALMIGLLRLQGRSMEACFNGQGYAPKPLSKKEKNGPALTGKIGVTWCLPDWLVPPLIDSLGKKAEETARALQKRAPMTLRVNLAKAEVVQIRAQLAQAGVETRLNPICSTALTVTSGGRALRSSALYQDGWVELQDAASQAVVETLPKSGRALDFCAGGGGKALALAVDASRQVFAHDHDPGRMRHLPVRAQRAGVEIVLSDRADLTSAAPFDLVLCDVPCSGSGAWRRAPEGKWNLTPDGLRALHRQQNAILDTARKLTSQKGMLAYATCSVLRNENEDRIAAFLERHQGWRCVFQKRFSVSEDCDGFFIAHLLRET